MTSVRRMTSTRAVATPLGRGLAAALVAASVAAAVLAVVLVSPSPALALVRVEEARAVACLNVGHQASTAVFISSPSDRSKAATSIHMGSSTCPSGSEMERPYMKP